MTYVSLGILKGSEGKFEEVETLSLKALNIYREALGPDDRNIATIQSDFAGMYLHMERFEDAEWMLGNALEFHERVGGPPDDVMKVRMHLGMASAFGSAMSTSTWASRSCSSPRSLSE